MNKRIAGSLATILFVSSWSVGTAGSEPKLNVGSKRIVPPMKAVIGDLQLRKSKTPIYLPAWLPAKAMGRYASCYGESANPEDKGWYEVVLSTEPQAFGYNTLSSIHGAEGKPRPNSKTQVCFQNGKTGYISSYRDGLGVSWATGKYWYEIVVPHGCTRQDLIKAANSVVLVAP